VANSRFHQYFTGSFCVNILGPKKKLQSKAVIKEKLCQALSYGKVACKMLMKLTTPSVKRMLKSVCEKVN